MNNSGKAGIVLAALFLLVGAASASDVILIKNATVVPVTGPAIPGGSLLIKDGKIAAIGPDISAPAQARIIDAAGKFVYPGLVAVMTSVGVTGYPGAGSDISGGGSEGTSSGATTSKSSGGTSTIQEVASRDDSASRFNGDRKV